MIETIKKNWITYLGLLFVFFAFLYFLKLAIDEAWIPPVARVAIGLALGVTGAFAGYSLYRKEPSRKAEFISGFGLSLLYATFAYASFSNEILWSPNTLLMSVVATTLAVGWVSARYQMRILIFMCVLGGLLTPLIIRAEAEQVWLLFFYVFALNAMAIYLSAVRDWKELRIIAFAVTIVIYALYYTFFDPQSWGQPFFYIIALFVTYFAGLLLASWYSKKEFEGINLYLSLLNAINFAFWSVFILNSFTLAYTGPALIIGAAFMGAGFLIYRLNNGSLVAPGIYFLLGVVVIAIALNDFGLQYTASGMHHVIGTFTWLSLIMLAFAAAHFLHSYYGKQLSVGAWIVLMVYWFSKAWQVEWTNWFGLDYIPFLNPGGLVWISLATSGFVMSQLFDSYAQQELERNQLKDAKDHKRFSLGLAVASHAVVGGLLTIQVQNLWSAYQIHAISLSFTLSVTWMVYALLLFCWGAFTNTSIFRLLGSAVLLLVSIKIFFFDLGQASSLQKVIFLFVVGLLTLLISWVNRKWADKVTQQKQPIAEEKEEATEQ